MVSSSRYLVKQGELNKLVTEGTSRIPFGRKSKEHIYLFLFNDILLVTKKRGSVDLCVFLVCGLFLSMLVIVWR